MEMKLKIEYRKVSELLPYARTHSDAQVSQLAASIKEFGFNNPVAIDADGMILCGHGRVMAAQKLHLTEVPTVCLSHLSETQVKAYILADMERYDKRGRTRKARASDITDITLTTPTYGVII